MRIPHDLTDDIIESLKEIIDTLTKGRWSKGTEHNVPVIQSGGGDHKVTIVNIYLEKKES